MHVGPYSYMYVIVHLCIFLLSTCILASTLYLLYVMHTCMLYVYHTYNNMYILGPTAYRNVIHLPSNSTKEVDMRKIVLW